MGGLSFKDFRYQEQEDAKRSDHASLLPLSTIVLVGVVRMAVRSGFAQLMLQKFDYCLSEQVARQCQPTHTENGALVNTGSEMRLAIMVLV
jgi:hypothetical protein